MPRDHRIRRLQKWLQQIARGMPAGEVQGVFDRPKRLARQTGLGVSQDRCGAGQGEI
jgi:hypothetical protein